MSRWFRAYAETLNDPKVQTLPLDAFKAWHNALYLATSLDSTDGNIGSLSDVAYAFRETKEAVSSAFHHLTERGLIETDGETFRIVSWKKRQYKSDTSTARVQKYRKRSKTVTETAPETEQNRTEQKESPSLRSGDTAPKASVPSTPRKTALPPLFPGQPELTWAVNHWTEKGRLDLAVRVQDEADQFRDYHGGKNRTLALDWPATWRTWARKALTMSRAPPGSRQHDKPEWKPINLETL